ncbi:halocyanin domain-containing protein [Halomicroarcula sp. GCM10025324]|jgi:halocyanin-like protein|uniref:halocyanin domain-containing protein n=1 Tax=Haloarcula TaxID=2237 RepID=UPI0023E826CD|nr:halocyanin domain-containing protein [Halomicroarcula sp. ZS-22-S1]
MAVQRPTRRQVLQGVLVGTVAGLAGCSGDGGGDGGDDEVSADDYPVIDRWLTETELGGAADNYDGSFADERGADTVTVDVGAEGNGGAFAFGPAAAVVSAGTTVEFRWTGGGNPHNVEALPEEQLGESDYEFSSGEAEGGSGVKYTVTLDEPGIVLYHCEPHFSLGMKGGIAVE